MLTQGFTLGYSRSSLREGACGISEGRCYPASSVHRRCDNSGQKGAINVMSANCLVRRLAGVAGVLLLCSAGVAQQANQPAPQPNQGSPQSTASSNSSPSQLPDAPGRSVAAPGTQTGGTARPGTAHSSPPPAQLYWSETNPNVQVTVLEDTRLSVLTDAAIDTAKIHVGKPLTFTLTEDVLVDDLLVIPRGATLHGEAVAVKKAGKLAGSPDLILKLVSLDLEGRSYPVYSYQFKVEGTSKTSPTENKIKTGAKTGTVIGAVVGAAIDESVNGTGTPAVAGTLAGMGAGAAAGAGVGTVVAVASPGPVIDIPAESEIDFYLASPMSIVPVSRREAERLSEGLYSGGPVLYVRGERP